MKHSTNTNINNQQEVNLKLFFRKIYKHRLFYIFSILSFVAIAFLYIKLTTPIYQVSTSILIDPSGNNRGLGESKYIDGGVSPIEMDKNLYNEIGIIKSFNLIGQTVEDLDFDITYHTGNHLTLKEHYAYFPFEVTLFKTEAQLYDIPFQVEILSNQKYRLSIAADKFMVSNPANSSSHEVNRDFNFSKEFSFGETVKNDYFNFRLDKPGYKVNMEDFSGKKLSFILHDQDAVTQAYLNKIEVNNIDIKASIFKIVSYGEVVNKEVEFLDKLTENYIQNKLKSRNKIATTKELFIRDQLNIIRDSLFIFESNLETFKRDEGAVNLGESAINALESTQNLQTARAKINLEVKYYTSLKNEIEANRNRNYFVIPTSMGINNTLINENIIALNRLYAERTKKKYYVTENNEEMTILNEQINASTDKLLGNLRNAIQSSKMEAQGMSARLSNYDNELSMLPTREKQLLSIERQSTLYENLFNYLNQELAKTGIARAESTSDTHVLDQARQVGDGPVAPQKLLLLVLAVILGIIFPLAWILLFSSNDTIENVGQIVANSQIAVIGKIVHYDKKRGKTKGDLSLWKVKESFRDLSANLQFYKSEKSCIIGITSIMPKEGKTFCAINLGITFAELGKRTIIVDTDLRKPSLVDHIKKVEGKGLSNYLQGEIDSIDTIISSHDTLENLHFIPTFVADGNIHELLSGVKMKSLIHKLRENYDYILFDTPASGLVSDFILVRDELDVNLFVLRRNIAKIEFLEAIEKLIPLNKEDKSFIVFNDILIKDYKYGYGQKYGMDQASKLIESALVV